MLRRRNGSPHFTGAPTAPPLLTWPSMRFRFEGCEFQPAERRLLVRGVDAVIGGRAFDLLLALVENHERVVSTDELYERVWPGVAVEANNLQVQIWALRKLLGRHLIANVPRRGYRFMAAVQRLPDAAPSPAAAEAMPAAAAWLDASSAAVAASLLQSHRLVTLVGHQAAALRRTAGEVATRLAADPRGAVWQAQAAVFSGQAAGPGRLPPDAERTLLEASSRLHELLQHIQRRPATLVLFDGHLAAGLATAVPAQLQAAPRLRLLLQAAQPIGWPGEQVVVVTEAPPALDDGRAAIGLRWHSR